MANVWSRVGFSARPCSISRDFWTPAWSICRGPHHGASGISASGRFCSFSKCIERNSLNRWKKRMTTVAPWQLLANFVIFPSISSSANVLWLRRFSSEKRKDSTIWHIACLRWKSKNNHQKLKIFHFLGTLEARKTNMVEPYTVLGPLVEHMG